MFDAMMQMDHGRLGILLGFTGILSFALIFVTAVIATQWRKVRQSEIEASLKAQMLEQGLSAEEIERVTAAGTRSWLHACSPEKHWKGAEVGSRRR